MRRPPSAGNVAGGSPAAVREPQPRRVRSARTLVFSREEGDIVAFNYLANSAFSCSPDLFSLLSFLDDWRDFSEIAAFVHGMTTEEAAATVASLVEVNALVEEGSDLAETEDRFASTWKWGMPAALFHFSLLDRKYMSLDEAEAFQIRKATEVRPPPLYLRNDLTDCMTFALPPALEQNDLLQLMARRRTVRSAEPEPITISQLSDCLFAGLGITGETRNAVGTLPLAMTPSGGARNPYEAYVYARDIEGLEPGFYHYSAAEHTLAKLKTAARPLPSELMGGQDWTDAMPCVVILCALFERTMWKYEDANAYRVVLIEAGHIGQNLMLAATRHGLSACPSAALNHSRISECVTMGDRHTQAPIYALTLARPGPVPD